MEPNIVLVDDIAVLPCPFCGDKRIRYYGGGGDPEASAYAEIICAGCGAKIRRDAFADSASARYMLREAAAAWNRRADGEKEERHAH